jgi:hypothetical protein
MTGRPWPRQYSTNPLPHGAVDEFCPFFKDKVDAIRTADVPEPAFSPVPPGLSFAEFQPVSVGDVISAIGGQPGQELIY